MPSVTYQVAISEEVMGKVVSANVEVDVASMDMKFSVPTAATTDLCPLKKVRLSSDVEVPELQGFCTLLQTFTISSQITQAVRKRSNMVFVMKERCYKLQACNWVDQHQGPDSEVFGLHIGRVID